jgi:hypothetical protein
VRLSRNGPRVLLEFLAEVGFENDCAADIGNRLAAYSSLTPDVLQVTGGDRLVPWQPLLVPDDGAPSRPRQAVVRVEGKR